MYKSDYHRWTQIQAIALRTGRLQDIDAENLAAEIEDMGRQQRQELANRLGILIGHLLKWQYQPGKRSPSWQATIRAQRKSIAKLVERNPSIKPYLEEEAIEDSYLDALVLAINETDLDSFPEECAYSIEQILDDLFLPQ